MGLGYSSFFMETICSHPSVSPRQSVLPFRAISFTSQLLLLFALMLTQQVGAQNRESTKQPNILFAFADDWGWPHAGVYGDPVVKTGYVTGVSSKGWGPGRPETAGRQLVGPRFRNFDAFLKKRPKNKPFCYWLGTSDPHRGYVKGSGKKSGMDLSKIKLFAHFPDSLEVRGDVADYYLEVQRFDRLVGTALAALEEAGELDDTIVVMSGDHGMPFPRCKSNNYDSGARIPLAIRWPAKVKAGMVVKDFVSLTDLAPTFYETAGVPIPGDVTGHSLLPLLAGKDKTDRSYVLHGKERHVPGQEAPDMGGYPTRAIRTHDFLYLHNFWPDRWPAGTPNYQKAVIAGAWLADCDNGPTNHFTFF